MAGKSEQERKDQAAQQKGNLGQKEAEIEKRKESELEHMGERSQEQNK